MILKDKHVVLTGASSGIGREIALTLGGENRLELLGRDIESLENLAVRFPNSNAWQCDLSQRGEVEQTARKLTERCEQPIDIIILNAAVQTPQSLSTPSFDMDTAETELTINFLSICSLINQLLPFLPKGAVIALVNTGLAIAPKKSSPIYCASKAALRSLGHSLSYDLTPRGIHIRQIYLPLVDTPMTQGRGSKKITAEYAARSVLQGIEGKREETFVGKTAILWWLSRIAPRVARKILANQ
ncbi:SDR family NAD(P)-dependent oxidoreductase [Puniceicoccaceae bacterium K14]|nr:SDR family NAD(P)-dependent oxidoreductase [Puniceicoccaceae bacterium K14]